MKVQSKVIAAIVTVSVLVGGAWVNGYTKASQSHRDGSMNLLTVGLELLTMNSISAHGYQTYLEGVIKEAAQKEAQQQLKQRTQDKISQVANSCLSEVSKATDSTVSFESTITGDNSHVRFTAKIWNTAKIANFVCNYSGNVITNIEGTTVK